MDSSTSCRMKRPTNCNIDQPSSSKLPQIASTSTAIGAAIHAEGYARVTITNMNVGHHPHPTLPQEPHGIEFQVSDPIDTFRGREQTFLEVKDAFDEQKDKQPYNLVAVCGYGGMGKTQVARMYVKRNRLEIQNVVWIFAESVTTMDHSFTQLQNMLKDNGYPCYCEQDVYKHLNSDSNLFIFDNSKDIRSIQTFLPTKHNKSLFLITSQSKSWDAFNKIELQLLDTTDTEDIMTAILVEKYKIDISDTQIKELVQKFEFESIPLLLQIRAGYICRQVQILRKRGKQYDINEIVNELNIKHDLVTEKFHNFILDPYDKSIFAAIYQTLEQIWNAEDETSKTAAKILGISAYLNPDDIEENILKNFLQIENETILNDSLDILDQFSLLQISDNIIGIHRTVQQCLQYHHREIIKSNEYYQLTFPVLVSEDYFHQRHHETIFKYGEKDFESLCTFYERNKNKCNIFHKNLVAFAPSKIIQLLLTKFGNPDLVYQVVKWRTRDIMLGTDYNVKDDQGFNAIFYVYLQRDYVNNDISIICNWHDLIAWNTMKHLTKNGADVNSQNFEGNIIIHSLCNIGKSLPEQDDIIFVLCALMIILGANPGIKNNSNQTTADLAREHGLTLTYQLLDAAISGYKYISHIAIKLQQFNFLAWLFRNKICYIDDLDDTGCSVLHVLASIAQLDKENENILLFKAACLFAGQHFSGNGSIVNNSGETPSDVARRYGREQLADLFDAWTPSDRITSHLSKLERFSFVSGERSDRVNEQDDSGCTLLHAICGLDTSGEKDGDTELELDIIKLAAELVIQYYANVHIRNDHNDTAADVARRRGRHLLADLLVRTRYHQVDLLLRVALKYEQFNLVKHAWWRYIYLKLRSGLFPSSIEYMMLWIFEEVPNVTDAALINFIHYLHLMNMYECSDNEYYIIVEIAMQHGREALADWLQIRACKFKDVTKIK